MTKTAVYLSLAILGILTSCGLSPRAPMLRGAPNHALELAQKKALADPSFAFDGWIDDQWWRLFDDPQLNALIIQCLSSNPSIAVAEARTQLAAAYKRKSRAPLFPRVNFETDVTRLHSSKFGIFGILNASDPAYPLTYMQKNLVFSFEYEFDIWKKNANQVMAAASEQQALIIESDTVRLSLAISVAESYFKLQTNRIRIALAEKLAKNRSLINEIAQQRRDQGLANEWKVNQSANETIIAKQFLSQIVQDEETSSHALQSLLAGDFNQEIYAVRPNRSLAIPFPLPATLPLDLLSHRPDIRIQKWKIRAAAHLKCAAKADFYPNINMAGGLGLQALSFNPWFNQNSVAGILYGPALHLPIFSGGLIQAQYDAKTADYCRAIAEYDHLVFEAVKEVLDALTIMQNTAEGLRLAEESLAIARQNSEIALEQFNNNLISQLEILSYENQELQAEDAVLQSQLACLQARLFLIRALGGGY